MIAILIHTCRNIFLKDPWFSQTKDHEIGKSTNLSNEIMSYVMLKKSFINVFFIEM